MTVRQNTWAVQTSSLLYHQYQNIIIYFFKSSWIKRMDFFSFFFFLLHLGFLNWLDAITFSPSVACQTPHYHRNERVTPLLNPLRLLFERGFSNPTAGPEGLKNNINNKKNRQNSPHGKIEENVTFKCLSSASSLKFAPEKKWNKKWSKPRKFLWVRNRVRWRRERETSWGEGVDQLRVTLTPSQPPPMSKIEWEGRRKRRKRRPGGQRRFKKSPALCVTLLIMLERRKRSTADASSTSPPLRRPHLRPSGRRWGPDTNFFFASLIRFV